MILTLDFSGARETACHSYTGVRAHVTGSDAIVLSITPDGAVHGQLPGDATPVQTAAVDRAQAWAAAFLITGRESVEPIGEGEWDQTSRRFTIPLRLGRRAIF